jgi:hypothetical protein
MNIALHREASHYDSILKSKKKKRARASENEAVA